MSFCSFTKKKTGSVFPAFCLATFHYALSRAVISPSVVHCLMYHGQDTFDFSQGHVTKNQPMAIPV